MPVDKYKFIIILMRFRRNTNDRLSLYIKETHLVVRPFSRNRYVRIARDYVL